MKPGVVALAVLLVLLACGGCRTTTATTRSDPVIESKKVTAARYERQGAVISARVQDGMKVLFKVENQLRCIQTVVTTMKTTVTEDKKLVESTEKKRRPPGPVDVSEAFTSAITSAIRGVAESKKQYDERTASSEEIVAPECARSTPAEGPVVLHLPGSEDESRPLGNLDNGEFVFDMAVLDRALLDYVETSSQPQLDLGSNQTSALFSVQDNEVRVTSWLGDETVLDGGVESIEPLITVPASGFPTLWSALAKARAEAEAQEARLAAIRDAAEAAKRREKEAAAREQAAADAERERIAAKRENDRVRERAKKTAAYMRTPAFKQRVGGQPGLDVLTQGAEGACRIWKARGQVRELSKQTGMYTYTREIQYEADAGARAYNTAIRQFNAHGTFRDFLFFAHWLARTRVCPGVVPDDDVGEPAPPSDLDL